MKYTFAEMNPAIADLMRLAAERIALARHEALLVDGEGCVVLENLLAAQGMVNQAIAEYGRGGDA